MTVRATTDHATITALLDEQIAADPVRGTVLGTIRNDLRESAWCAYVADAVVVRSDAVHQVVLGGTWSPAELRELAGLLAQVPRLAGVSGETAAVGILAPALPAATRRTGTRLFRLDALTEPAGVAGAPRRAGEADRDLLLGWYRAFHDEAGGGALEIGRAVDIALSDGGAWLWVEGERPVSLATRRPVIAGSARVGPVYTPPEHRGHGYGSAVTAAATADILGDGAIPVLFTDLANPVSNAIYPRLGYYPVEDRTIILFG